MDGLYLWICADFYPSSGAHLGRIEFHLGLIEDAVLGQVIVQIATVHQIENEAQFVGRMECVRHAHNERTVDLCRFGYATNGFD